MAVHGVRDASGTGSRSTQQAAQAPVGCPAAAAAPILQRLNEQQRAAATHPLDRPLLVQAGAGTGKTTTLIARVAYTLQQYTKRMAVEAKQRLARQRLPGADRVVCSTCHAFCFRVIRDFYWEAGFARPPSVLHDSQELEPVLERCVKMARLQALRRRACRCLGLPVEGASWQQVLEALWAQGPERRQAISSILAAARQEAAGRQHSRDEQRQRREQRQAPTLAKRRADAAARAAAWLAEEESPSKAARTAEARCNGGIQSPQQAGRQAASAAAASGSQELPGGRSRRQLQLEEQACEGSDTQQDGGPGSLTQGPQTQEPADPARRLFGDDSPAPAAAEAAAEAAAAEADAATAVDEAAAAAEEAIPWLAGLDLEVQIDLLAGLYRMLPAPPAPPAQQAQQAQQAEQAQQEAEVDAMLAALEEDGLWRGVQYVARDDLKALRSWISEQKALGRTPACFPEGWQRGAWELFQSELKRLCKVDFSDMIAETNDLLRRGGEVADKLRRRYTHVFVDEFQDCSPPQIELALLLGGPAGRVTAVGDAAQSIFGFSAATPHAFSIFATAVRQLYGLEASRLALTLNYRSTASVLKVGNELLGGDHPELVAASGERGEPVVITAYRTAPDEAAGIADRIQALVQEGVALDEIAVLFRYFNWGGKTYLRLQAELEARGIPYRRLRAKKVLEDRTVQVLLAWLRLLLDPSDDSSFLVAMAEPKRELGEAVEAALLEHQAHQQLVTGQTPSLESCALDLSTGAGPAARQLSSTQREALASLLSLLRRLRGEMWTRQPAEMIDRVLEASGLFEHWQQQQRVQAANEGSDDEGEEEEEEGAPAADEAPEERDQEAAGEAAGGGGEEEEQQQQGGARDIFKVYRHRCRAGGPLGALQREAAAFSLGVWQAGDRAAQDGSGIDACGGPSLQRIAYRTLFARGGGCEAELLEHLLSQEESGAGGRSGGGSGAALGGYTSQAAALLASIAAAHCLRPLPLADFLEHVAMDAGEENDPFNRGVAISTIHSAKGREWDVVFSPRWYEGFMPSSLFDNQHLGVMPEPLHPATIGGVPVPQEGGAAEHRAEARRLAHVAATRARRRHFISYPCKMVSKRGWPYEVQPSSFLEGVLERYRDTPTLELELAN